LLYGQVGNAPIRSKTKMMRRMVPIDIVTLPKAYGATVIPVIARGSRVGA
jgi:hypothetical protein